jgi:hypothetical protein
MFMDSAAGLAVAVVVISSIAWVSQFRKIRDRIRAKKKVVQADQASAKAA